jgi:hypothetical protein
LLYRAGIAQWHRDRRAARPKTAKLAARERLHEYVQDRLPGVIRAGRIRDSGSADGYSSWSK